MTISVVAADAAVSRQTVSNVLNAPHRVRPDTRQRVEEVIARTGYRPLKSAQTLRRSHSDLLAVGLRPPSRLPSPVLDVFLHAVSAEARRRGYRIMLASGADDVSETAAYGELLGDYQIDGVILTGTHIDDHRIPWLLARRVPFVSFGRSWDHEPRHPWVDVDGGAGVRHATEHLHRAGRKRIAFVGWPHGSGVGEDRRSGWEQACRVGGLPTRGLLRRVEDDLVAGRQACASLLDADRPPDAIVCVSDVLAISAWVELTARGLVPGIDVSVIGFDDSPAAAAIGLTSVAQPVELAAGSCLDRLQTLLRKPAEDLGPAGQVLLAPSLVRRASG